MKKGFTLVELLAVIVILAIIALIAVPIIMNVVESSRKGAATSSAYGYIDGVKIMYAKEMLSGSDFTLDGKFNVDAEGKLEGHDVEVEGTKAKGGYLTYSDGKITEGCLTVGDYKVTIENDSITETIKGVCDSVSKAKSFAEDSWETIIANVKAGTTDAYNVGDKKEVALNGFEGTFTLRVANKSTPEACNKNDFSQTACGFVVEFEDIITGYRMNSADDANPHGTNKGGWEASEMRKYLNVIEGEADSGTIYNALPNDLKKGIIDTKVMSGHGKGDTNNFITMDKLYLLSPHEVWETNLFYDTVYNNTRQLDYYKGVTTTENYSVAIKNYKDSAWIWWLRTAPSYYPEVFYSVSGGRFNIEKLSFTEIGVAPAFRIG